MSGSESGSADAASSSSGDEVCACTDQRLTWNTRGGSAPNGALIKASIADNGAVWIREEPPEGGGVIAHYDENLDFVDAWADQQLSLHAPVRMAASAAGAAFGEFVPLDEIWRLQLFDNVGLRVCYLDRDMFLFPTLPPPGGWAFLQPGAVATRLSASCDEEQAEEVSLAEISDEVELVDAVWSTNTVVVLGSRSMDAGRAPFAATLDRTDGSLRATSTLAPPRLGHRWSASNDGTLLTLHDESTVGVYTLDPTGGALTLLTEVDGTGVTEATALPHPTDPWLVLDGEAPRVQRIFEEPCCAAMQLELEGTTVSLHAARRVDDTLILVREFDDDGSVELGLHSFVLE